MNTTHGLIALGACCLLALGSGCGQPPLQLHFPEGLERSYEVSEQKEMEMTMPVINQGMRQTERTNSTVRVAVADPGAEGAGTMRIVFDDLTVGMSMSFMGESMTLEGEDSPMGALTEAVIGEEFRVTVEPNGNIVGFEGFDELMDKVLDSIGLGAITQGEMGMMMEEMWSADQQRMSIQKSIFPHLPMTPVETGDTWTVTYTVTDPMPMQIEDTYTVLNVYEDRVTIDVASILTPHPTESSIDMGGGFSMNMEVNGDGEGFLEVDRETGWLNEASTTLRIRGEAEFVGMPVDVPGGMDKIPMTARVQFDSRAI